MSEQTSEGPTNVPVTYVDHCAVISEIQAKRGGKKRVIKEEKGGETAQEEEEEEEEGRARIWGND